MRFYASKLSTMHPKNLKAFALIVQVSKDQLSKTIYETWCSLIDQRRVSVIWDAVNLVPDALLSLATRMRHFSFPGNEAGMQWYGVFSKQSYKMQHSMVWYRRRVPVARSIKNSWSTPAGSFNRGELLSFMTIVHFLPDINECLTIVPSPCSCGVSGEPCGANCINLMPSFTCSCAPGFQLRSGGTICDGKNYYFLVRRKCFSMWNVLGVSINVFFYFDMI